MKRIPAAGPLSATLVLAPPASAMAFNPQPDPPGKVAVAEISQIVASIVALLVPTLCHSLPPDPVLPPDPICARPTTNG